MSHPLFLRGGNIVTMDATSPRAEAMLVRDGRIVEVGRNDEIAGDLPSGTETVDLEGRCVIPGLIDAHAHMEREGLKDIRISLADARSLDDVLSRVAAAAAVTPKGEWIVTMPVGTAPYYLDGALALVEGRLPNRWELDDVAPDHAVYIMAPFGTWSRVPTHAALNSLALERAGILEGARARCDGVEIVCDSDGVPSGIIIERNERPSLEFDLLKSLPGFTWHQRFEAIQRSMRVYNDAGTTSVYEGHGSYAMSVGLYRQLWEERKLSVRVSLTISPTWSNTDEARRIMRDWLGFARGRGLGDEWLRVSGVYIGFGGNACILELMRESLPDTGWAGFVEWCNDEEQYAALVSLAAEFDLRVHTVILEDLGRVLPIFERLAERYPIARRRWVMEHVGQLAPSDYQRVRRLGLIITTIPVYQLWKNGDEYFNAPNEGNEVAAHKSLLETGITVAIGTDNIPVSLFKAMAVTRQRREHVTGRCIGPDQRLDGMAALRTCTIEAARLSFEEDLKGSLTPGKLADFSILPCDPTTVDERTLETLKPDATVVDGRFVYRA
ncbi:MAG: amidohydrolase [bacterium]|nr:amidohydrolase [bacterium]